MNTNPVETENSNKEESKNVFNIIQDLIQHVDYVTNNSDLLSVLLAPVSFFFKSSDNESKL